MPACAGMTVESGSESSVVVFVLMAQVRSCGHFNGEAKLRTLSMLMAAISLAEHWWTLIGIGFAILAGGARAIGFPPWACLFVMALPGTVLSFVIFNPFLHVPDALGIWTFVARYLIFSLMITLLGGLLFNWIPFLVSLTLVLETILPRAKPDTWTRSRYVMFWCTFASYPLTQLLLMKLNAPEMPRPV